MDWQYAVQILPFDTRKFEYTPEPNLDKDNDTSQAVLQSYPVTIATVNGSGPIPTAFTVEHQRPRQDNNQVENLFLQFGTGNSFIASQRAILMFINLFPFFHAGARSRAFSVPM